MAVVITEEASDWQVDRHLVSGLHVDRQNNGGAVLLILHVFLTRARHHLAVNPQAGAGGQRVARRTGVTVDCECQAVDTRAGNGEDARAYIVAVTEVDEDVLVGDELVVAEGAKAFQAVFIG